MDLIVYGMLKGEVRKKADLNSPHFTGEPTAPTPPSSDDSNKIATTEYVKDVMELEVEPVVDQEIDKLIQGESDEKIIELFRD